MSDIIPLLAQKAGIDSAILPRIRVFEVHSHKHVKELQPTYPVMSFNDFTTLCADIRSEEEQDVQEPDRIAYAFSFDRETNKAHGFPFSFVVKEGELLSAAKERISKRMQVKGKGFEKIKFAVVAKQGYTKPEYLSDGEFSHSVVSSDLMAYRGHFVGETGSRRLSRPGSSCQEPWIYGSW